jgi:uncharacterized protein
MSDENKSMIEKVNTSFAEGNIEGFLDHCTDDVTWTMLGENPVSGKTSIREWMKEMECPEPPSFTVDSLISEGDVVVSAGEMTMKNKEGAAEAYSYCDIYRFSDGKINELKSFVIKNKSADTERSAAA